MSGLEQTHRTPWGAGRRRGRSTQTRPGQPRTGTHRRSECQTGRGIWILNVQLKLSYCGGMLKLGRGGFCNLIGGHGLD